jgi:hypothetical protein
LQVFHIDIAKVDQDVTYVAMAIHVCCKRLFGMFHLFFSDICCKYFYLNVAYVSHIYCKKSLYLDVAYVLQCLFEVLSDIFVSVSDACFKCFICLQTML